MGEAGMRSDRRPTGVSRPQTPPEDYAEPTTRRDQIICHGEETGRRCWTPGCDESVYRLDEDCYCLDDHRQPVVGVR